MTFDGRQRLSKKNTTIFYIINSTFLTRLKPNSNFLSIFCLTAYSWCCPSDFAAVTAVAAFYAAAAATTAGLNLQLCFLLLTHSVL